MEFQENEAKHSQAKVRVFLLWVLMLQPLVLHHDMVMAALTQPSQNHGIGKAGKTLQDH